MEIIYHHNLNLKIYIKKRKYIKEYNSLVIALEPQKGIEKRKRQVNSPKQINC